MRSRVGPVAPSGGAASGIIDMLEVILGDFSKSLAEITAAEDTAASEYEATTHENKVDKSAKDQDVKYQIKAWTC